jgi:CRP/FNR family transcriptional regulator
LADRTPDLSELQRNALKSILGDESSAQFVRHCRARSVISHQTLFSEGDTIDYVALVISGVVKIMKSLADGRQQLVSLKFPPDFIGRPFHAVSHVRAEAASDVELLCLPKDRFEKQLRAFPDVEHHLLEHTLVDLDDAQDWMLVLGRKSASERIATLLLMISDRIGHSACAGPRVNSSAQFHLPLTRSEMAEYLGLTIETVSRHMTLLRSAGLIEIKNSREIKIVNIDALKNVAAVESS